MRRGSRARIATLVFVIFTMTAPAFAAPPGDDSPIGAFERVISRIADIVRQILPLDLPIASGGPKP